MVNANDHDERLDAFLRANAPRAPEPKRRWTVLEGTGSPRSRRWWVPAAMAAGLAAAWFGAPRRDVPVADPITAAAILEQTYAASLEEADDSADAGEDYILLAGYVSARR